MCKVKCDVWGCVDNMSGDCSRTELEVGDWGDCTSLHLDKDKEEDLGIHHVLGSPFVFQVEDTF